MGGRYGDQTSLLGVGGRKEVGGPTHDPTHSTPVETHQGSRGSGCSPSPPDVSPKCQALRPQANGSLPRNTDRSTSRSDIHASGVGRHVPAALGPSLVSHHVRKDRGTSSQSGVLYKCFEGIWVWTGGPRYPISLLVPWGVGCLKHKYVFVIHDSRPPVPTPHRRVCHP